MKNNPQSGNVLFIILLAIFMIGGLTMILSDSSTSTGETGEAENTSVQAGRILRYGRSLESAVQQLLLNGCSESDISFENPINTNYENTNNPSDESCFIFSDKGAGLTYQDLGTSAVNADGNTAITGDIAINNVGTVAGELVYTAGVDSKICTFINNQMNNDTSSIGVTEDVYDAYFTGTYTTGSAIGGGGEADSLDGEAIGCVLLDSTTYTAYFTLLKR